MTSYTLHAIHERIGGKLSGHGDALITGVNALDNAQPGEITFAEHPRFVSHVRATHASAVLVPAQFPALPDKNLVHVANPRLAFVQVMELFHVPPAELPGMHPTAVVSPQATVGPTVTVGECAVIRAGAVIGDGTVVGAGAYIESDVRTGTRCVIGPHVVLRQGTRLGHRVMIHSGSVVGDDGFGYVWAGERYVKIPQLGNVIIEDDVEIGTNVCVDRAMFGSTIIRRGTKIDNLVQIAHNDVIGEDVMITGQVGLSGSVHVGNRVVFGGQAGVADHVTIGHGARIGAGTPVIKNVKAGETIWGFPGHAVREAKREIASLTYLPALLGKFRRLLARFARVESSLKSMGQSHVDARRHKHSSRT